VHAPDAVRILLVDDQPANLFALEQVLASPEYELVKAESGERALAFLLRSDCAVILLDVSMPGMDGYEVARLVRQGPRTREIPIVFVTAMAQDERDVLVGYERGAIDYLVKPVRAEVLRSKVAGFVALYRARQEIRRQAEQLRAHELLEHRHALAELELRALQRQQAVQRRYQTLVEGLVRAVAWVLDPVSLVPRLVSPGARELLGLDPEWWSAAPRPWPERVHPEDRGRFVAALAALVPGGPAARLEHRMVALDGRTLWVETSVRLIGGEEPGTQELHGLSTDVTAVIEAREEARSAVLAREQFLSIASHELRTPLTALSLQARMLTQVVDRVAEAAPLRDELRRRVTSVQRQVARLAALTDSVLDLTRIRTARLWLELESCDLCEVVRDVAARFEEGLRADGRRLAVEAPRPLLGRWDRTRLEQLVSNLVANAVKHGGAGDITVTAEATGEEAVITVSDTGPGIPEAEQTRIFDAFTQGTRAASGGLGLGLYIARSIACAHGGRISLASAQGSGTSFRIELPLDPGADARTLAPARAGSPASP
jgi:signal transduction histidine kinase